MPKITKISTKTLEELEAALHRLAGIYLGDATLRKECRAAVIEAKTRARFAARNPKVDEATRARKEEMVQWALVWLDDPAMFEAWAFARHRAIR